VTNNAAKPDCIHPTGDDGSLYAGHSSGKLIAIKIKLNTALKEAAIVSKMQTQEINETLLSRKQQACQKCKHRQSQLDFPNTDSKKISTWVSLLKRNNLPNLQKFDFTCVCAFFSRIFAQEFFFKQIQIVYTASF
jgi:hypothetical protein